MLGVLREEVRCIDRRVAAAHDGDHLVLIRVPIAQLAVVHAAIEVVRLLRQGELAAVHARSDDDDGRLVDARLGLHDLRRTL